MTNDAPALEVRDLVVEYERKRQRPLRAVAGVSLSVHRGEIVGLVGESGCGKSTLAKAAVGLVPTRSGQVLFEGEPVTHLGRRARPQRERQLQLVFQDPQSSLNGRRSVGAQIVDGLKLATGVPEDEYDVEISRLLDQVGLSKKASGAYPHQFSGGQRQRICIARALAARPSVLVADEPISALDASAQAQIANLLIELTRELGIAMLFISHDLSIVHEVADRVEVMYLGKVVEAGRPRDIWGRPLHPYSKALVRAVPTVDKSELPEFLAGEVPDPALPPPGCRFHTRCQFVHDRCRTEAPELLEIESGQSASCWLQAPGELQDLDALEPTVSAQEIEQEHLNTDGALANHGLELRDDG